MGRRDAPKYALDGRFLWGCPFRTAALRARSRTTLTMIHETQFSGPSDMLAMCDLNITLRKNNLGTEHSGDLNWAAYMHSQMNPQRDTRLWWDGAALAAWATYNKYG